MTSVAKALDEALEPPDSYFGAITELQLQGWGVVFGRNRDSDNLAISNYETVLARFNEKYLVNDDFRVEGSSHWLCGWMDQLLVRALDCGCEDWENAEFIKEGTQWECVSCGVPATVRQIFHDALEIAEALQDYPVLDEEDYSRREHEDLLEYIGNELHYATSELSEEVADKITAEAVAARLFDTHSVSSLEDLKDEWIVEAVKEIT